MSDLDLEPRPVTAPADPLTVEELRKQCGIIHTDDDALLTRYMRAAVARFPRVAGGFVVGSGGRYKICTAIRGLSSVPLARLPFDRSRATSVSIDGVPLVEGTDFKVTGGTTTLPRLRFVSNGSPVKRSGQLVCEWPAGSVAEDALMAVLLLTAHYFEHREDGSPLKIESIPHGFDALVESLVPGGMSR